MGLFASKAYLHFNVTCRVRIIVSCSTPFLVSRRAKSWFLRCRGTVFGEIIHERRPAIL